MPLLKLKNNSLNENTTIEQKLVGALLGDGWLEKKV
jgi:hypothetical protein